MSPRDLNLSAFLENSQLFTGYWARTRRVHGPDAEPEDFHLEGRDLLEPDSLEPFTVTRADLAKAIDRIVQGEVKVGSRIRTQLAAFSALIDKPDALYLCQLEGEPDPLDCTVQVAALGAIIYG